jgi:methylenetetrahydrofolate dehydrogenase (NADP+)/methenyltetrahydrofolate cyclohydrolase
MKLLLGKPIAKKIYQQILRQIKQTKIKPGFAIIMVGKDKASSVFVRLKIKKAKKLGFYFRTYFLPAKISQTKILEIIEKCNHDKKISGIIVQMPLPKHLNPNKIVQKILPEKDIDGFHPKTKFIPPVHQAILKLLQVEKTKLAGKKILILANSSTFAKPLETALKKRKSRVKTAFKIKLSEIKKADIIITALGKPKIIKGKMVKNGTVIIDVGYSRFGKKVFGDVDQKSCLKRAKAISPVPGGVGPLTVAFLMKNVLKAAKIHKV